MSTEEAEKVQAIVAEGVAREGLQEMVLPAEEAAAKRLAAFVSDAAVDRMIADAQDAVVSPLDGPGGLIGQLTARVIERGRRRNGRSPGLREGDPAGNEDREFPERLLREDGYHDVGAGAGFGSAGPETEFEPQIVAKGQRRVGPGR